MAYAVPYLCALVIFAVIDLTWLTIMSKHLYRPTLGDILLTDVNLKPAAAFYLFYPVGLMIFAIAPALKSGDLRAAAVMGALFGLFAYGTYDLTNQATLRNWTTTLTLADIAWGTFVSGVASVATAWIATKIA
jgi:uncharacterized membrane protein